MKHTNCYVKGYPRPQFVRNNWQDLCGVWDFAFDYDDIGEKNKWYTSFPFNQKIVVPFSYQTVASEVNIPQSCNNIWYHRTVTYNIDDFINNRLLLNFEGSDYTTKVWVNGIFIGTHNGGYTRFTFDITLAVAQYGVADIVVKCSDSHEKTQPRGKQTCLDKSFGCWYQETSGIWKSVWSEFVPDTYLQRIKITPDAHSYYVEFEGTLNNFKAGYSLRAEVSYQGHIVSSITSLITQRIFAFKADISNGIDLFGVKTWSPDNPQLYDVNFSLVSPQGEVTDKIGSYLGFRSFVAVNNSLLLNNNPIYLRMALFQGYHKDSGLTAPTELSIEQDVMLAKSMGLNGLRLHEKVEDERFYYYADVYGLMLWTEMPSAYEYRDATIDQIVPQWQDVIKQNYNHPSTVCWVPINESWGVPHILTDSAQQHLATALYNVTKAYDRMRPVISNDGWEHTCSDIATLHNYCQDGDKLGHFYADCNKVLDNQYIIDYPQFRLSYSQGHSYSGQPIVISEFAGIGYDADQAQKGWGYGTSVGSAEQFIERLTALVKALRSNDSICGFCITQLTDVETEVNGLTDISRKPKADIEKIKGAILSK